MGTMKRMRTTYLYNKRVQIKAESNTPLMGKILKICELTFVRRAYTSWKDGSILND